MPTLRTLSDSATLVQFGDELDLAVNRRVHALATLLALHPLAGVTETVPAYASLTVHYDPLILSHNQVSEWVGIHIDSAEVHALQSPRRIEVPVRYGSEYGPDLGFVATHCHLGIADVIRLHSAQTYTVFMMGFTPGFPYMGKLDDALITPRLETPRSLVRAGTVAIAGAQTGIYPIDSPGGWRLIGFTPLTLFNSISESPFLFAPNDKVRFVPTAEDFDVT